LPNKKIIVRAEDVPLFVELLKEKQIDCIGLTGEDLFLEYQLKNPKNKLKVFEKINWVDPNAFFKKPALCLLGKRDKVISKSIIAINKKYSNITKNYFKNQECPKKKIFFSGSTETAFDTKLTDFVIDIVYSGASAKSSGLVILDVIKKSDVVVIQ
jgi:ATP phosphoribosyltransferase